PTTKLAVTDLAAPMFTLQISPNVPETASHPVQPLTNTEPRAGAAVRVTVVPITYGAEQSVPQLIPPGLEVTVPLPMPVLLTESASISFTVNVVLPLAPVPSLTEIVVVPRATAAARPTALTVATAALLLVHVRPVPVIFTAVGESIVAPLPSWPNSFFPQHPTA